MRISGLAIVALAMSVSTAAVAQERTGYQLLAKGRYATAIDRLEQDRQTNAALPEQTLNLATAYARIGRVTEARALYQEVLAEPAVDLDLMAGASATSHQVARRGLSMMSQTIASR